MPRDGSGNYTLPVGNPVISGTTIESNWANTTMEDVADALTGSLSRNGNGGMLAPLGFVDGTESTPGMYFTSQVNMGLHRANLNDLRIVMAGTSQVQITNAAMTVNVPLTVNGATTTTGVLTASHIALNGNVNSMLDVDRNGTGVVDAILRNDDGGTALRHTGSATFQIRGRDAANGDQGLLASFVQGGSANLYFNTALALETITDGVRVRPSASNLNANLYLRDANAEHGILFKATAGNLTLRNTELNQVVGIDGDSGSNQRLATFDPRATTSNATLEVKKSTFIVANLENTGTAPGHVRVANADGGFVLGAEAAGGFIKASNTIGTYSDLVMNWNADAELELYYNGLKRAVTGPNGFDITGNLTATGSVTAGTSDLRTKDVTSWVNPAKCLYSLLGWSVIRYTDKEINPSFSKEEQLGLIAQEVQSDFPEMVAPAPFDIDEATGKSISGKDYLTLKYDRLTAVLVGAIQRLHIELEDANRDIARLRAAINSRPTS